MPSVVFDVRDAVAGFVPLDVAPAALVDGDRPVTVTRNHGELEFVIHPRLAARGDDDAGTVDFRVGVFHGLVLPGSHPFFTGPRSAWVRARVPSRSAFPCWH